MKPWLFYCDIDGTLLRGEMAIPDEVKAAAKRFARAGGHLVLCTGRSQLSTAWIAREMEVDMPGIVHSGAMLYDFRQEKPIRGTPIPGDVNALLSRLLDGYPEVSVQACTAERTLLLRDNEVLRTRGVRLEMEPFVSRLDEVTGAVYKIVLTCDDPELLDRCGNTVFEDKAYRFAFASRRFAETVAATADKAAAVLSFAGEMGIPMERTFAAGDAMTDYGMMKACGYTFAPEDANRDVLAVCDMVIPSCEKGGVAQAFDHAVAMMEKMR